MTSEIHDDSNHHAPTIPISARIAQCDVNQHLARKAGQQKHKGHVLKLESLSLPIRLSTLLRTFLSFAMAFEALRTAWDTADSLTLYP